MVAVLKSPSLNRPAVESSKGAVFACWALSSRASCVNAASTCTLSLADVSQNASMRSYAAHSWPSVSGTTRSLARSDFVAATNSINTQTGTITENFRIFYGLKISGQRWQPLPLAHVNSIITRTEYTLNRALFCIVSVSVTKANEIYMHILIC